jgi:hypothetical protein
MSPSLETMEMDSVVDCDDYDNPSRGRVYYAGAAISTYDACYPPFPTSHYALPSLHVAAPFFPPFFVFFLPSSISPSLLHGRILRRSSELYSSELIQILWTYPSVQRLCYFKT